MNTPKSVVRQTRQENMVNALFSELNPDQRLERLAVILAAGVRRYNHRLRRSGSCPEKEVSESSPTGLEVPGNPRLSVSRCFGV